MFLKMNSVLEIELVYCLGWLMTHVTHYFHLLQVSLPSGIPVSGFPVTLSLAGSGSGGMITVPVGSTDPATGNIILDPSTTAQLGSFVSVSSVGALQPGGVGGSTLLNIGPRQTVLSLPVQRGNEALSVKHLSFFSSFLFYEFVLLVINN
jgi:hypothetical protein